MFLSHIDTQHISDEIIEKVLFDTPTVEYTMADCLILFGCHIKELLEERIAQAIDLFRTKKINKMIVTGGIGVQGDFNEAEYMKERLIQSGIDKHFILMENQSTTTEENIQNSLVLLKQNNLLEQKTIVLVSNQPHLRRIGMNLKKQLSNVCCTIIYEYPRNTCLSLMQVLQQPALRTLAINEIKKIIQFIQSGILDDTWVDIPPKNIIFSHQSDIDGLNCVILGKLAFNQIDFALVPNVETLELSFRKELESGKLNHYDSIFITDLALYEPALTMIAESPLKNKIHIFDHHKRSIDDHMDKYDFVKIVEKDQKGKRCGTELFYEYLVQNNLLHPNPAIKEFVELTRLEDTWEWKQAGNLGIKAHDLAILYHGLGREIYLLNSFSKLQHHSTSFTFDKEELILIQKKKKEYEDILKSIMSSAEYFTDEQNIPFGIVFANYEYRNELAEYVKRIGNPQKIQYLIIVAMNQCEFGQKSYRTIEEGFDVNKIAVMHGGGGHPNAAAVNITKEQKEKIFVLSKKEALKYLADSIYIKEKELAKKTGH